MLVVLASCYPSHLRRLPVPTTPASTAATSRTVGLREVMMRILHRLPWHRNRGSSLSLYQISKNLHTALIYNIWLNHSERIACPSISCTNWWQFALSVDAGQVQSAPDVTMYDRVKVICANKTICLWLWCVLCIYSVRTGFHSMFITPWTWKQWKKC